MVNKEKFSRGSEKEHGKDILETRKKIIDVLNKELESNPNVKVAFLVGSDAQKKVDEYSDIDFDIVLDPESVEEIEKLVKSCLEKVSPIKTELRRMTTKGALQVIYQLEMSRFLRADVVFLPGIEYMDMTGPEIKILFDKDAIIKHKEPQENELIEKIRKRIVGMEKYEELRQTSLERELNRGNYLESIEKYYGLILETLVEALRLQYCPAKSEYYLKHISRDLPKEVVKEIEDLYKVSSVDEIKEKNEKASELLKQTLEELKIKIQTKD